jgi:hypothetical protein
VPEQILIDEFHMSVRAPRGLANAEYRAIRRTLDDRRFQADLRQAVSSVVRRYRSLRRARITLSR